MKRLSIFLIAAMTMLAGCSDSGASKNSSVSDTTEASASSASSESTSTEKKPDIVLTMAMCSEPWNDMKALIDRFNEEDNGVRVEIKSFWDGLDEDGNYTGMTDEIQEQIDFAVTQELINEDTIDLVGQFSFGNAAKYEIFKRKGGFVDLYEFMKDDPEVNRETLNSHILDLCERDGKLYSIPTYYTAYTMISKSGYGGNKRNWNIDEFIDHWDKMPAGSTVNWSMTSEGIYYDVLRMNTPAFIDYKNCEVHFDHPDFRKMLEFCHRFDSNMGQKRDGDIAYDNPQLVEYLILGDYSQALVEEENYTNNTVAFPHLRDGSYTLVGYPTSDRNGAYLCGMGECSIRSNISKEKQEAAWKFLREFYREEYQAENYAFCDRIQMPDGEVVQYTMRGGFPINNAARKTVAEKTIKDEYLSDSHKEGTLSFGGPNDPATFLTDQKITQADIDYIDDYIASIDRWEQPHTDRALFNIIEEEVLTYFHGGQDVDTAVDHIQNRASIWISEQG